MAFSFQSLASTHEPFLWEMLYQALHVPAGQAAPPRDVIYEPTLARYVRGWGRPGDGGVLAVETASGQPAGAAWLRLLAGANAGYGHVADDIPELSMAVWPVHRGQGLGTQLLTHLLATASAHTPISLSVAATNPARRLYQRFGFTLVRADATALVLLRNP